MIDECRHIHNLSDICTAPETKKINSKTLWEEKHSTYTRRSQTNSFFFQVLTIYLTLCKYAVQSSLLPLFRYPWFSTHRVRLRHVNTIMTFYVPAQSHKTTRTFFRTILDGSRRAINCRNFLPLEKGSAL